MSPEKRALLCCARVDLDAEARAELLRLTEVGLDFQTLVRDAQRHGITPLLCRHLSLTIADVCPPEVLSRLQNETQTNTLTSFALSAELVVVLDLFRKAGLDPLAIKGPVSAALCYGDLGLRTFGDVDVLIAPHEVDRAMQVLKARGYAPQLTLPRGFDRELVRVGHERLFRHPDGVRLVDLHWYLMQPGYSFTPDDASIFARRSSVRLGATAVTTLGLEPTLLFLLLHGIKHDWSHLGWLCDVAELIRRQALDWDGILAWSAPSGRRRLIDVGLSLSHSVLEAPVPATVRERGARDPVVKQIVHKLTQRLLGTETRQRSSLLARSLGVPYFEAMARSSDRLRFMHDVVLKPTQHEWRALPLPTHLAPLYYLVRPLRLFWKHARPRSA